jgi:uncharacterized protein (DUF3084 family)
MIVAIEILLFILIGYIVFRFTKVLDKRFEFLDKQEEILDKRNELINQRSKQLDEREKALDEGFEVLAERERIVIQAAKNVGILDEYDDYEKPTLLN